MAHTTVIIGIVARVAGIMLVVAPGCAEAGAIDTAGQAPHERCGYCHELDGNSRMEGFPRLAGQTFDYLVKQLHDFRARRRAGTMQATAELLSDAEIIAVARYFNAQSPSATANASPATHDRQAAEHLHRRGDSARGIPACSSCHGANGEGRGGIPRLAGQHAAYLEAQLLDFKRGARVNDGEGVMRSIVSAATEREIHALARYFTSFDSR
ncbi:MAG: c-type cytochrome [Gammaproteobacteria bacterium]|nr:c-type cytochrome [Gammaproteobacteria bacterium]